ncbi:MAG: DUF3810 family protein [Gemmatimonadetes bacterium]|nr:DUF3810 family protein [Gemmatimonadota bacterium]
METIRIPNDATNAPVSLTDVMLAAPMVSRLLLGATLPGRLIQLAAFGLYAGSALRDWAERQGVRRIDFRREFGADLRTLTPMMPEVREAEVRTLVERLNDEYTPRRIPRAELAVEVDRHLTAYIASITGQRVETSTQVRSFALVQVLFPFALGTCDMLTGDVAIFKDTGIFEPHVIAHEFTHRKGYWKELEAQALAYLALASSGEPVLVQSALAERLHRDLRVLAGDDAADFRRRVEASGLRAEVATQFMALRPDLDPLMEKVAAVMRVLYEERMRLTGQNGLSDYDRGFTDFLYTFEESDTAVQDVPPAAAVRPVRPRTGPRAARRF